MDPVTIAILGITAAGVIAIKIYKTIKSKNEEIEALQSSLETHSQSYSFEACDEVVIKRVSEYLARKFGGNFEDVFNKYPSLDEKKVFFQTIAQEIAKEMQVELNSVTISEIDCYTRGYTSEDGKNITINETLLIADPKQAVKTLCHELRHCMQFQAIKDNKWGFSSERIAAWIYSFQRYSEAQYSYCAYFNTIVEVDANKFAYKIFND